MSPAWTVELLKARRSPVMRTALVAMALVAPFFAVGAALLAADGTSSGSLAGAKVATMVHGVGWVAVSGAFGQVVTVLWLLGTGVVAAWICGREYSDRTLGQLLGIPTPASKIAAAKLGVVVLGAGVAALAAGILVLIGGLAAGMGAPEAGDLQALVAGVLAAIASAWTALPFAWVATVGKGYLPAVGALLAVVMVTQVVVLLGGGSWFPWAVPSLLVGAGGEQAAASVGVLGVVLVAVVGAAAWAATVRTWSRLQLV